MSRSVNHESSGRVPLGKVAGMQHTRFGRTGLQVPRLTLGTMTFAGQCDRDTSFAIMDAAVEAGITFFDTADMYPVTTYPHGMGDTERVIGEWMHGRRADVLVASKCFFPTGHRPWEAGPRSNTPIDETLQALDDIVHAGKARYVGCSNVLAYQLARSLGRSEALGTVRFDSVQPRYNMLFREFERELFPLCEQEGVAVIPYNPLAGGMLTAKHRRDDPADGTRFAAGQQGDRYRERYWHDHMFTTIDAMRSLANPAVTSPIVGASRPEQLADAVIAAATPIDPAVKAQLDELTVEYRRGDSPR